ncbi:hypothetical protein [Phytoactinopolyspora mesophila]|uniref:Uncharacterized protein n=1 Tax=Phytoactinopolyspora mesophila TaxID=2650750 RepID=A0A7K3MAT6_9ACTN|nr:hypothetical protein [Phytoactinopolyspora mesophila]NDL60419.1 hypothetical protein [Phytoactinopolyspora mesophila]
MTDHQSSGDDHGVDPSADATATQLAALALVRLCIRDEPASLSVDLLTEEDGTIDVGVVQELVNLSANLTYTLADVLDVGPEELLDGLVREVVNDDENEQS